MYATARLVTLLAAAALCVATPYYLPQQRQLFYSVVPQYQQYQQYPQYPQYSQYSAPVAPAPAAYPYRQLYYSAPQPAANLVAAVPSSLRYPAPLVAPGKQVLYYPGANPYAANLVFGDDNSEGSNSWTSWFSNFASAFVPASAASPESPAAGEGSNAEITSPAAGTPSKGEQAANSEQPAKEGEEEEETVKPNEEAKVKGLAQKYVLVGQPQYFGNFGNFDLQRVNPAAVIPSAHNGAVSSYLLLKNFPGVKFAPQIPQLPQVPQADEAEVIPAGQPGAAALDYQKLLQESQGARQQKDYDDSSSIVVEAAQKDVTDDGKVSVAADEDKESEDEETGTK